MSVLQFETRKPVRFPAGLSTLCDILYSMQGKDLVLAEYQLSWFLSEPFRLTCFSTGALSGKLVIFLSYPIGNGSQRILFTYSEDITARCWRLRQKSNRYYTERILIMYRSRQKLGQAGGFVITQVHVDQQRILLLNRESGESTRSMVWTRPLRQQELGYSHKQGGQSHLEMGCEETVSGGSPYAVNTYITSVVYYRLTVVACLKKTLESYQSTCFSFCYRRVELQKS